MTKVTKANAKDGDFLKLGHLGREVALLLCVKIVAITILFVLFFSPAHRLTVDERQLDHHLLHNAEGQKPREENRP